MRQFKVQIQIKTETYINNLRRVETDRVRKGQIETDNPRQI